MTVSTKNRGKDLEALVLQSNRVYRLRGEALMHQAHAEVKMIRGQKTGKAKRGKVIDAFHEGKAGLDFYGISNGRYITFDAKQTTEQSNFPLRNVKKHQMDTAMETARAGGIAFLLVRFSAHNETYYLSAEQLRGWWEQQDTTGGRKSIPYQWFVGHCKRVESGNAAALDWLSVVREELGSD
ncbi:Holliday junction resolvase RecU [Exiguobacterium sp. s183]|uniref:Holliday junction resolvase RecU n=1 Tax=Exiguobacterium sp. s183 TaxID=2751262 RepID=UPI001BE5895C|nr:Holliday junction resolvase RecU [Exiguobacterium sp. s183]